MKKGDHLGQLEELVILTIAGHENKMYAVPLKEELEKISGRTYNISAIHAVLYRLEKKGLLTSFFAEATKERGGKKKRYFQITDAGFQAVSELKMIRQELWNNIPGNIQYHPG